VVARKVTVETVRQALADGGLPVSQVPGDGGIQVASGTDGCPIPGCCSSPSRQVIAVSLTGVDNARAALLGAAAVLRARGLGHRGAGVLTPPITPGPVPFTAHLELFT
jgi:hypothetical protein